MRSLYKAAWELARLAPRLQALGSDLSYPRDHYSNCPRRNGGDYCACDEGWDDEFEKETWLLEKMQKRKEELQRELGVSIHGLRLMVYAVVSLRIRQAWQDTFGAFKISLYQRHHHSRYYLRKREKANKRYEVWR